ncbi:MAG: histidine phosphatase family protein [SAR86 cluster bacterium]|nr:histidine phosphatase family protein [SAR86 cluster bacterium]
MKQIFLLRHAKSDWSTLGQQDFERPLVKRGINDALLISQYIQDKKHSVDAVFCSSAIRTKETFDLCAHSFNFSIEKATYLDELYFVSVDKAIKLIKGLDNNLSSVLLVGHNPTMHILLEEITGKTIDSFSTCALAQICIENSWKDLSLKNCELKSFIRPKELKT